MADVIFMFGKEISQTSRVTAVISGTAASVCLSASACEKCVLVSVRRCHHGCDPTWKAPKPGCALSSSFSPAPDGFAIYGVGGTGNTSTVDFADWTKPAWQWLLALSS